LNSATYTQYEKNQAIKLQVNFKQEKSKFKMHSYVLIKKQGAPQVTALVQTLKGNPSVCVESQKGRTELRGRSVGSKDMHYIGLLL
jgi:hypothetical protein